MHASAPTIVLVHGALTDASVWTAVISDLRADGHTVLAPAMPLRRLGADAEYLAAFLDSIDGPVVLAGHSYGGSIISHPALGSGKVQALVFVSAFQPDAGESTGELNGRWPGSKLGEDTTFVRTYPDGEDLYLRPEAFAEVYARDLPPDTVGDGRRSATGRSGRPWRVILRHADLARAPVVDPRLYAGQLVAGHSPASDGRAGRLDSRRGGRIARLTPIAARQRRRAHPPSRHRAGSRGPLTQLAEPRPNDKEQPMTNLEPLLARNLQFAATDTRHHTPPLPFLPHLGLFVVCCIDCRVDPADYLGLRFGEALVARNVGGRVTPELIRDIAYASFLVEEKAPDGPYFEVAVVHHTDCGTRLLEDADLRHAFADRGGYDEQALATVPVTDPPQTVRQDVERLRDAPQISRRITISGHVYDVHTGRVTTVVEVTAPSPLAEV